MKEIEENKLRKIKVNDVSEDNRVTRTRTFHKVTVNIRNTHLEAAKCYLPMN